MKLITLLAILFALVVAPAASAQGSDGDQAVIQEVDFGRQAAHAVILPLELNVVANSPDIEFSWSYFSSSGAYFGREPGEEYQLGPLVPTHKTQIDSNRWVFEFVIRSLPKLDTHYLITTTARFPTCTCRDGFLAGFRVRDPKPRQSLKVAVQRSTISAQAGMSVVAPLPSVYNAQLSLQRLVRGSWQTVRRVTSRGRLYTEREDDRAFIKPLVVKYKLPQLRRGSRYRVVFRYSAKLQLGTTLAKARIVRQVLV